MFRSRAKARITAWDEQRAARSRRGPSVTPAARLAAAISVLDDWAAGRPAEAALAGWARGARYAGSKDRAAVRDHVFDILRTRGRCAALGGGESGRALVLGHLRLRGQDPAEVFTGLGHAPQALSRSELDPREDPGPGADVPGWLHSELRADLGEQASAVLAAMEWRAPLFLRVNARAALREEAMRVLAEDGIAAVPDPGCATALRVAEGGRRLRLSRAYLDGWVEPQDLSVQIACAAVAWPGGGGRILDFCAGGGGKALAIAAVSDAEIWVHDADRRRMADISPRATRAGVTLHDVGPSGPGRHGPFDLVLADVPCSGSGTWRRDPEAKWRLTPARLEDLTVLQSEILESAAGLVRPGGRLVYMTCSLLRRENRDRVDRFLSEHPDWHQTAELVLNPATASDGFFLSELTHRTAVS